MAIAGLADGEDPSVAQADRQPAGLAQYARVEL
jgi:hypothetical protein